MERNLKAGKACKRHYFRKIIAHTMWDNYWNWKNDYKTCYYQCTTCDTITIADYDKPVPKKQAGIFGDLDKLKKGIRDAIQTNKKRDTSSTKHFIKTRMSNA